MFDKKGAGVNGISARASVTTKNHRFTGKDGAFIFLSKITLHVEDFQKNE